MYMEAWEHFRMYWEQGKVKCEMDISLAITPEAIHIRTYVILRDKKILVHQRQFLPSTSESDCWFMTLQELQNAGAAKMYESIVMMLRESPPMMNFSYNKMAQHPMTPSEAHEKDRNR